MSDRYRIPVRRLRDGASTTEFARRDGIWAVPAGGGGGTPGGSDTHLQFNDSGAFGGDADFTYSGGGVISMGSVSGASVDVWAGSIRLRTSAYLQFYNTDDTWNGLLQLGDLTDDRQWELPDVSGIIAIASEGAGVIQFFGYSNNLNSSDNLTWDLDVGFLKVLGGVGIVTDGDLEVTDPAKGVILASPDTTRWRVTVGNDGALTTTAI